nr:hypothetical protein [uncultured Desulfobulbus sp.]
MQLDAYSIADLQITLGMLAQAESSGLDISGLRSMIEQRVESTTNPQQPQQPPPGQVPCPTDGCPGVLVPWPKSTAEAGVPIVGCLLCRYSMIEVRK